MIGVPELPDAPGAIRTLVTELTANAFRLVSQEGSGPVNIVLVLQRGRCGVRISADRGEWWIEMGGAAIGDWFDPDIWDACLRDVPVATEPMELEERTKFVRHRWRDVAKAIDTPSDIVSCLDRQRSTRARTRLGLPPRLDW